MSVICGLLTYLVLIVMGVPFAGVLALFVAITDLLPIVGAVARRAGGDRRRQHPHAWPRWSSW